MELMKETKRRPHTWSRVFDTISVISALLVLGIAVLVNLFFARIPASYTAIDLSAGGLYSLSAETEAVLAALDQETCIYWIVESGNENIQIEYLLERYQERSPFITIEKIDPIIYPDFAEAYTDSSLTNNSLLVRQGTSGRFLDYYEIFTVDYGIYGDGITDTVFDGENLLTSAISTLTHQYETRVYVISGHDETALPAALTLLLERENYFLQDLRLLSHGQVPADADVLILADPRRDLSQGEGAMLEAYLEQGGELLAFTSYSEEKLPVLEGLLSRYGLEKSGGIVFEGDSSMYYGTYQMYLLASLRSHAITDPLLRGGYYVLMPLCDGLLVRDDAPAGCEISVLLESSPRSYSKPDGYSIRTVEQEEGDREGPFALAAAVTEKTATGEGRVVWFGSSQMLDPDVDGEVSGANSELVANAMGWLSEREPSLNIRSKNLTSGKLVMSENTKIVHSVMLLGAIPAVLIGVGIAIHIRRRSR